MKYLVTSWSLVECQTLIRDEWRIHAAKNWYDTHIPSTFIRLVLVQSTLKILAWLLRKLQKSFPFSSHSIVNWLASSSVPMLISCSQSRHFWGITEVHILQPSQSISTEDTWIGKWRVVESGHMYKQDQHVCVYVHVYKHISPTEWIPSLG